MEIIVILNIYFYVFLYILHVFIIFIFKYFIIKYHLLNLLFILIINL